MSAEIIHAFNFGPRAPNDRHTELCITADLHMLDGIIQWAVAKKTACAREARPLYPSERLLVMDVTDVLDL